MYTLLQNGTSLTFYDIFNNCFPIVVIFGTVFTE